MSKVEFIGGVDLPSVYITREAKTWIDAIVSQHSEEVGWMGIVDKDDDNNYIISEIFYPKNDLTTGTTCEIHSGAQADMMRYYVNKNEDYKIPKIKFWGHSHVNMGVGPSGQDDKQGLEYAHSNGDYMIRGIFNKKGDYNITIYDVEAKLKYYDLPLNVIDSADIIAAKAADIRSLKQDGGISDQDLLLNIRNIINSSYVDYKSIEKKVAELKKVNIKEVTYNNRYGGTWGNQKKYTPNAKQAKQDKKFRGTLDSILDELDDTEFFGGRI